MGLKHLSSPGCKSLASVQGGTRQSLHTGSRRIKNSESWPYVQSSPCAPHIPLGQPTEKVYSWDEAGKAGFLLFVYGVSL